MIAMVEFTTGVLRNGITQWYFVFAKEVPQVGLQAEYVVKNWGFMSMVASIIGGFGAGWISDRFFHSRRGPSAAVACFVTFSLMLIMTIFLKTEPNLIAISVLIMFSSLIGVHSLMSGTAAADFGGRKAAASASGIVDGFVYIGSAVQSFALGKLIPLNWAYWPMFLFPFTIMSLYFTIRMWHAIPESTKKYLLSVEKVDLSQRRGKNFLSLRRKKKALQPAD